MRPKPSLNMAAAPSAEISSAVVYLKLTSHAKVN